MSARWDCDLLIIGTGFGGAVCALRAAARGLRVVVIERGMPVTTRRWEDIADGRARLFRRHDADDGLIEVIRTHRVCSVVASALGGGSQIYTAATVRARDDVLDHGWPAGWTARSFAPWYDRVERMIQPNQVSADLPRIKSLIEIGRRMGRGVERLPLAIKRVDGGTTRSDDRTQRRDVGSTRRQVDARAVENSVDVTEMGEPRVADGHESVRAHLTMWLRGGRSYGKTALDRTYLASAVRAGAVIRTGCEATNIAPTSGGYRVAVRSSFAGPFDGIEIRAPRVVVAAGTFHTVRLLLMCRDRYRTLPRLSAALGSRFHTNGDAGALLIAPSCDVNPDSGPPTTAWIDCWDTDRLFLMEQGCLPNLPPRCVAWAFAVMGYDASTFRLLLGSNDRIHSVPQQRDVDYSQRVRGRVRELADAAGAWLLRAPDGLTNRWPITVHPLGGARMSESPTDGVVDSRGEVYGYPGLFVADGSVIPSPLGVPPSLTIAAVAEGIMERMS